MSSAACRAPSLPALLRSAALLSRAACRSSSSSSKSASKAAQQLNAFSSDPRGRDAGAHAEDPLPLAQDRTEGDAADAGEHASLSNSTPTTTFQLDHSYLNRSIVPSRERRWLAYSGRTPAVQSALEEVEREWREERIGLHLLASPLRRCVATRTTLPNSLMLKLRLVCADALLQRSSSPAEDEQTIEEEEDEELAQHADDSRQQRHGQRQLRSGLALVPVTSYLDKTAGLRRGAWVFLHPSAVQGVLATPALAKRLAAQQQEQRSEAGSSHKGRRSDVEGSEKGGRGTSAYVHPLVSSAAKGAGDSSSSDWRGIISRSLRIETLIQAGFAPASLPPFLPPKTDGSAQAEESELEELVQQALQQIMAHSHALPQQVANAPATTTGTRAEAANVDEAALAESERADEQNVLREAQRLVDLADAARAASTSTSTSSAAGQARAHAPAPRLRTTRTGMALWRLRMWERGVREELEKEKKKEEEEVQCAVAE